MHDLTPAQRDELIVAAVAVRRHAYAPFSHFQVGAALLAESGEIYRGANIENSSYGLTNCAERVALGAAISAGERSFVAIAVASSGGCGPCGACRQCLSEFGEMLVIGVDVDIDGNSQKVAQEWTIAMLLPDSFKL